MIEKQVLVQNPAGIHARPAGKICKLCQQYDADVKLLFQEREARSRSILELMLLGVSSGDTLTLQATGAQAQEVIEALVELIENNFQGGPL